MRDHSGERLLIPPEELRHLVEGPRQAEVPGGVGLLEVRVSAPGAAAEVIARATAVLRVVVSMSPDDFRGSWAKRLPRWFVDGCSPERTGEADEAWLSWWRGLEPEARTLAARERPWALADWMHWMHPEERQWFWWDACVENAGSAVVLLEIPGWPPAIGALEWLLRVAGAASVDAVEVG